MERRDHRAVIFAIEESKRETLVAAYFFERIETHETKLVNTPQSQFTQTIGNLKEFLDLLVKSLDIFDLLHQERLYISASFVSPEEGQVFLERTQFVKENYQRNNESKKQENKPQKAPEKDVSRKKGFQIKHSGW
jgi:hypothetical protein